jgi:hypothetical protein
MVKTPTEIETQAAARKAFLVNERAREAAQRVTDEAKHRTAMRAKTARLKALREAREAATHLEEQAKKQDKPRPTGSRVGRKRDSGSR